jgi:hypothetical protein
MLPSGNNISFRFTDGDLRTFSINGSEIIQRIYFAVRDETWLNIEPSLHNLTSVVEGSTTIYSYDLLFQEKAINFTTHIVIRIDTHTGSLQIEASGEALSDFRKNRIGLCLHLNASLKGSRCDVIHTDGSSSSVELPILVSPHQPILNIRQMKLRTGHLTSEFIFEGDIFEMEDQRNWTDASYKIYSTPLALPFPVAVKKGDRFHQKISVTTSVETDAPTQTESLYGSMRPLPFPKLGTLIPENFSFEAFNGPAGNVAFPFSYLRIDFRLYRNGWEEKAKEHALLAREKQISIYAILYFSDRYEEEMADFCTFVYTFRLHDHIAWAALLSSTDFVLSGSILEKLVPKLRSTLPNVKAGAGTDANFAQLNRNRPSAEDLDFICYSIQPQEHASDKLSIIENIKGGFDTVRTAQSFADTKPVHISSLSIFRRFNANVDKICPDNSMERYRFAAGNLEAGWFIGVLNDLILAGTEAITAIFYPLHDSPLLELFRKFANRPPEFLLADGSTMPTTYSLLSWQSKGRQYTVAANLTNKEIFISHAELNLQLKPYEIKYVDH